MIDPVADLYWAALSTKHTVRASYAIACQALAQSVPGDLVECGVFAGANAAAMARGVLDIRKSYPGFDTGIRKVHLFDNFKGVPASGPHDVNWPHPEGISKCSKEELLGYMGEWKIPADLLQIHEGDFSRTVPAWAEAATQLGIRIAVLRLDADLYESTRICMENLFPLVSAGGWIIVDDFDLPGARKAVMEQVTEFGPVYFQKHA